MFKRQTGGRMRTILILLGALAAPGAVWANAASPVILATATSLHDTGLLDALIPLFGRKAGLTVKAVSVGTWQALAPAAGREADVVLTHAPELKLKYVAEGIVLNRRRVMHNDFLLLGA